MAVEEHFAIELPDDELQKTLTLDQFCRLIRQKCVYQEGFHAPTGREIYAFVAGVLTSEFSIPIDKIYPDSRFVLDMRLD